MSASKSSSSSSKSAPKVLSKETKLAKLAVRTKKSSSANVLGMIRRFRDIAGESKEEKAEEPIDALRRKSTSKPYIVTEEQLETVGMLKSIIGNMHLRTELGTVAVLTTSAAGLVNTVFANTGLAAVAEFPSFALLFEEFFIHSMTLHYQPLNQFQTQPLMSFALPATGLLVGVPLFHGGSSYTTTADMCANGQLAVMHSGVPWTMKWKNNESPVGGIVVSPATSSSTPTQSWCLTAATPAALYQGRLQIRNNFSFTDRKSVV